MIRRTMPPLPAIPCLVRIAAMAAFITLQQAALATALAAIPATIPAPPDTDRSRIDDIVTASHILSNEGVLDSYGHVSARSVSHPDHFFMPRAMTPSEVTAADIVELDMACRPVKPNAPRLNGERYIHCAIYQARSDVQSVIHAHDLAVIPFGLTGIPLRPVVAQAGFLPPETPLFDPRDAHDGTTPRGVEVRNPTTGQALAARLGGNPVVLMARHGETVVGPSVRIATVRALYVNIDARAEWAALAISHDIKPLDGEELRNNAAENFDADRPWRHYLDRLPAGHGPEAGPSPR